VLSFVAAGVAMAAGDDITVWHCAVAGLGGIGGAFAFINPEKSTGVEKFIAMLVAAAMASLLGPLLARWVGHEQPWVGHVNYYVTAAGGWVVGLISTPLLRLLHNPGPMFSFLIGLIPFFGKKG